MGAQPVLVDFLHERSPQVEHVEALRSAARDLDVPLVTYAGPRIDVVHPTREGYAAFAEDLRGRLEGAGLLDEKPSRDYGAGAVGASPAGGAATTSATSPCTPASAPLPSRSRACSRMMARTPRSKPS